MPRRLTSAAGKIAHWLEENPLIEGAIYFLASTADAEGGYVRLLRQIQIFR
jgi:hypothetical protein